MDEKGKTKIIGATTILAGVGATFLDVSLEHIIPQLAEYHSPQALIQNTGSQLLATLNTYVLEPSNEVFGVGLMGLGISQLYTHPQKK